MTSKLILEMMSKRERAYPTKVWRVVERPVIERADGKSKMLKEFKLVKRDLTFSGALHELQCARIQRFNEVKKSELVA